MDLYNTQLPFIGMKIKSIANRPEIELQNYCFSGTWIHCSNGYELIAIKWQNKKTGEIISNEQMFDNIFIF